MNGCAALAPAAYAPCDAAPSAPAGGASNRERDDAMKVYDNYEISPCRRFEETDSPGKFYFEVCEPDAADVWTLYGHINGDGVEAIGDFSTREHAEQVYSRITGLPFTGSYQAETRLRVMHAGPRLLGACEVALKNGDNYFSDDTKALLAAAIAEAASSSSLQPRKPIVIEVRGGVVQDVQNVPPGYEYEIKDYDDLEVEEKTEKAGRPA